MLRREVVGQTPTEYRWDGWDLVGETTGPSNTEYGVPDGQIWSFNRDGQTYQMHIDGLGSVRAVTDNAGTVAARLECGAWGARLDGSFDTTPGGTALGFVGGLGVRTDSVTGFVYMRNRWYDPTLMRFASRDPIGLVGGANLYWYALNVPSFIADPVGLQPSTTKTKYDAFYQRWGKRYQLGSFDGVEALLPRKGYEQGISVLRRQLEELSNCADSNLEFVTLLQAVYLSTSASRKFKAYSRYFFDTSGLQDRYHYAIAPGMHHWQLAYQDKLGPNADNTHHLAAFIAAGFNVGKEEAQLAAEAIDIGNPGDVALGRLGAEYGDILAHKQYGLRLSVEEQRRHRKNWIKALCDRLSRKK